MKGENDVISVSERGGGGIRIASPSLPFIGSTFWASRDGDLSIIFFSTVQDGPQMQIDYITSIPVLCEVAQLA
jgi:hypothetical protein